MLRRIYMIALAGIMLVALIGIPLHTTFAHTSSASSQSSTASLEQMIRAKGLAALRAQAAAADKHYKQSQAVIPNSVCQGNCYDGLDPYNSGCYRTSDVNNPDPKWTLTLWSYSGVPVGTLYNLYSSGCNTNWAQVWFNTTQSEVGLSIVDTPSFSRSYCWPAIPSNTSCPFSGTVPGGSGAWTDMRDGQFVDNACVGTYNVSLACKSR